MSAERPPVAFCLVGDSDLQIFSLTSRERLRRAFARAGAAPELTPTDLETATAAVVIRANYVFDESLVRAMVASPGVALRADDGEIVAAHAEGVENIRAAFSLVTEIEADASGTLFIVQDAPALASAYQKALRKRARPVLLPLDNAQAPEVERSLFGSSYKGVTDVVTKYVWPPLALPATRFCARHRISPNLVTWVSLACVIAATYLFWHAWFLSGLVLAWGMCFLDTVDGKLARCTLTSTKLGDVFDHGIDLVHPPFWYYAWFAGLGVAVAPELSWALWVVILGYVAGRIQEGIFIWAFGIEIHTWQRFDSWFRLITARRNPNLLILSVAALAQRPDEGLAWVAIWTIASFIVHSVRIGQAFLAKASGRAPRSWLQAPVEPTAGGPAAA